MWTTLALLALLVAFGAKLLAGLLGVVLTAVQRGGLLSNIVVDDETKLSVVVGTIQISVWRCVWSFFRAPSREKLCLIEVRSVQLLISIQHKPSGDQRPKVSAKTMGSVDLSASFKSLKHPMWATPCEWIRRLSFLCHFVHLIGVAVSEIGVDVIFDVGKVQQTVASIQHASIALQANYNQSSSEVSLALDISRELSTFIRIPAVEGSVILGAIELRARFPVSRGVGDTRAPLPSLISVNLSSVSADVDFQCLLRVITSSPGSKTSGFSSCEPSCVEVGEVNHSSTLLPIRIMEAIPDEIELHLSQIDIAIKHPKSYDTFIVSLTKLGSRLVQDRLHWKPSGSDEVVERKATLDIDQISLGADTDAAQTSASRAQLDNIRVEVDAKIASTALDPDEAEVDTSSCELAVSCESRVAIEGKKLFVQLADDLHPWTLLLWEILRETSSGFSGEEEALLPPHGSTSGNMAMEMAVQAKLHRSEVLVISREEKCSVLPKGVPSFGLSTDEITVLAHPFVSDEPLGIRSKANIQCSQLKVIQFPKDRLLKTPFLTLDFVRVFIDPVSPMTLNQIPADVEMEAEWLEVRWSPEALHAIGGLLELGIHVMSPFIQEAPDWESDLKWNPRVRQSIPNMKTIGDVTEDVIAESESIKFRCKVKRTLAMFSHSDGSVDYITVGFVQMSVEEKTGRFRISILETNVSHTESFGNVRSPRKGGRSLGSQQHPVRSSTNLSGRKALERLSSNSNRLGTNPDSDHYLYVKNFSLEETRVPMCPKTVVDMFADEVRVEWSVSMQVRIMELIRRITFSTWEMLYRIRAAYAKDCTPSSSRYNRYGGVNVDMSDLSECERCELVFRKIISASGDTLHRMRASNIEVQAKLHDDFALQLYVSLFGGDDLPELWTFRGIRLLCNATELLQVNEVRVRHTVDKRRDYTFGEFEELLRIRQVACRRLEQTARRDGVIIDADNVRVNVPTPFDWAKLAQAIENEIVPDMGKLALILASEWRPQQAIFYQFFLRAPQTPGQMRVWLEISNFAAECSDHPMETWLERLYPLWVEELEERDLRTHVLEEQLATLKLTNAEMLQVDAAEEMKELLDEKNAKIYAQKVKKLQAKLLHAGSDLKRGSFLSVSVGWISTDISFGSNEMEIVDRIRHLDQATGALDSAITSMEMPSKDWIPTFSLLVHQNIAVSVQDMSLRMRSFPTPVLLCDNIMCTGDVIISAPSCGDISKFKLTACLRCFMDVEVIVIRPIAFFGPGYVYTMQELASLALQVLPSLVLDVDKANGTAVWDILRRVFHGRARIIARDATLRLLASPTSFDLADFLEVALQSVAIEYSGGSTDVHIDRLTAKIEPEAVVNVAEFSSIYLHTRLEWSATGDSRLHYVYPVEFRQIDNLKSERVLVDLHRRRAILTTDTCCTERYFQPFAATGVSVFVNGRIAPRVVAGENGSTMTKRDIAARTAVVLYTKHVEWLIRFARLYQEIPKRRLPRQRLADSQAVVAPTLSPSASPMLQFLTVFKGLVVSEFDIVGLDVALYHSEKSPVGIRACINDKIGFSGSLLDEGHQIIRDSRDDKTASQRQIPIHWDGYKWLVHDVTLIVHDIQVRICTPRTGSRGESLLSVRGMCLNVGGNSHRIRAQFAPTAEPTVREAGDIPLAGGSDARPKKKNILEHFAIPQHNPYCFRDSDRDENSVNYLHTENADATSNSLQLAFFEECRELGFVLGLAATEAKVLVTLDAIETLVDIIENWIHVIRSCLPEIMSVSEDSITQLSVPPAEQLPAEMESPKKVKSLADDPRFGAIFRESILPEHRTRSFNASATAHVGQEAEDSNESVQAPSSVVSPFIMVRFMDCQVNFQDSQNKGSILLVLNSGTLRDSISADSRHEFIDLKVEGVQLFTAPLDVDVKSRVIWLRTLADGSYCYSSYGLLKQVIAPIPTHVSIWVDRDVAVTNKVDLQIPSVQVHVHRDSKDILENLITSVTAIVTTKIAQYQSPDYVKMLQGYRSLSEPNLRSIQQLLNLKKQIKWKIAELQWNHTCRLNNYSSERANVALHAAENGRHVAFEVETSPLFRRRRVSSTSASSITTGISFTGSTATQMETTEDIQRFYQQLESITEVLRSLIAAEQKKRQPNPNVQLEFALRDASLTLSAANSDIVRAVMGDLRFKMKMFEDQSGSFTLTIQNVTCDNVCPGAPFPELLIPAMNSKSWSGDNTFLRMDADVAPPVGGITIVKHFEVNVHPMQVCVTQDLILQLVAFFAPVASSGRQEEKKAEIRSQFLSVPQSGGSSGERLFKKAAKVAGKAAHPLSLGWGRHRERSEENAINAGRLKSLQVLHDEAATWVARIAKSESDSQLERSADSRSSSEASEDKDIAEMQDRAKNNILFKHIRIGTLDVVVTYKNKKLNHQSHQTLEDMRGFEVKIHSLVYCDKTCSMMDLLLRMRRDIIVDVLSQVGRNFANIANFLRDQFDITRWGTFDALAPLKNLSQSLGGVSPSAQPSRTASNNTSVPFNGLSVSHEGAQRSPRESQVSSPSDATKVFQLQLPENHPSLRKKTATHNPVPRPADIKTNVGMDSDSKEDGEEATAVVSPLHAQNSKRLRKMLSSLFSKSKKSNPSSPSAAATASVSADYDQARAPSAPATPRA
ncbi:hypothetical protein Poli38472_003993 [Pythium oligandrum]|uniref:ERV/ALR sulfhydryl oxidase domain-containing protein n=1 Tax=Pythium oligandrum TaxID=41045 RepID=A0A8K1CNN5_PYTOL|nr:hypothetical protein Poli38472_003993 [Pythium oligandrum]|eukprot:TMW66228.1 hypothetical protein Poli38472_003993 [Pythium oligandrum]